MNPRTQHHSLPWKTSAPRRIAAIALPELLLDILDLHDAEHPWAVIVREGVSGRLTAPAISEIGSSQRLAATCPRARRLGVMPGQTIAQATALVAGLRVASIVQQDIVARLVSIAEVVRNLGMVVSIDHQQSRTVWLDVTGVAHLFGGELALASEIQERVRLLGHLNRVVIASGPRIARALGHFGPVSSRGVHCVEHGNTAKALAELPLAALDIEHELQSWLSRLGLFRVSDLVDLPAKSSSPRLGKQARLILELAQGRDDFPLTPCDFPRQIEQRIEWEDAVEGLSPLLFALRGLISKLSARLSGRGEATTHLELLLSHDRAIARHRQVLGQTQLEFELSSPLFRETDLERVIRSRLERLDLPAPTVGLSLRATDLTPQAMHQLEFGQGSTLNLTELPVLLAELQADVGAQRVGLLSCPDSHLPEEKTKLVPISAATLAPRIIDTTTRRSRRRDKKAATSSPRPEQPQGQWLLKPGVKRARTASLRKATPLDRVTRLFSPSLPIQAPLAEGAGFLLGNVFYRIERLQFVQRLEGVKWWTQRAAHRDYLWAWLKSSEGDAEALVFVDQRDGRRFVQALVD